MKKELKKGDQCNSVWGIATVIANREESRYVDIKTSYGEYKIALESELVRIGSHAERMQIIIDTVFDAEHRLEDSETVQLKVGELAEFVRHYLAMRDELESAINADKHLGGQLIEAAQLSEKILKGEL